MPASRYSTFTVRVATLRSSPTTKTKRFSGPVCTAWTGTTEAFSSVRGATVTFTNMPGQRRLARLSNSAFTRIVPVAVSTALSRKLTRPLRICGRRRGFRGDGAGGERALQARELLLGQREGDLDGVDLGHRDEHRAVGLHEAAGPHADRARAAGEARVDPRVAERDLRGLDRREVDGELALERLDLVLRRVERGLRDELLHEELALALERALRVGEVGAVLLDLRLGLLQVRLLGARSSETRRSPLATVWPSRMCTSRTVLVICARMSTDCSATTVPLARSRTGTSRRSTVATVTGIAAPPPLAAACGALSGRDNASRRGREEATATRR